MDGWICSWAGLRQENHGFQASLPMLSEILSQSKHYKQLHTYCACGRRQMFWITFWGWGGVLSASLSAIPGTKEIIFKYLCSSHVNVFMD